MEFTWFTFPLCVLVVSIGSYALASWLKGDKLRINQATLVDVDVARGNVRGTTWMNVFSPQTARYDLSLVPQVPADLPAEQTRMLFTWLGQPEDAIGGMRGGASSWSNSGAPYFMNLDTGNLDRTPIQVWSTKTFTGRWTQSDVELAEADLKAKAGDLQSGTITSHLKIPLSDCYLAYGTSVYPIKDLPAGGKITVPVESKQQLGARLKGLRLVYQDSASKSSYEATEYRTDSDDIYDILEKMMFYALLDGEQYTQLRNTFQPFVDMSNQLVSGRAILIGRAKGSTVALQRDGAPMEVAETKDWTYYRFILPVENDKHEDSLR